MHGRLAKDALGLKEVLFCIVTGAAPLAAMLFNVPIAVLGGGYAAPAAFIIATVVLTIFSVGYIEMSQRMRTAGGFYAFIAHGLGSVAGMGSATLIALCYIIFTAAVTGTGSYFTATSVEDWTGAAIPAWVFMIVFLALFALFAWFHIELTARVLGVALITEVLALLVLAVGILVAGGGPDGFSAKPLNPTEIFDNPAAISVFGAAAAGVALFGAFWSWVGFEMAPNYAEESKDPHRIAKAATYGSVIGLGVFYTFISYMFVTGWAERLGAGDRRPVRGQVRLGLPPAGRRVRRLGAHDGHRGAHHHELLRLRDGLLQHVRAYLYALGREGLIPRALGRTHPGATRPSWHRWS